MSEPDYSNITMSVRDSRGVFTFEEWQKMPPEVPPPLKLERYSNVAIEEHDDDVTGFIALCFFLVLLLVMAAVILR